VGFLTSLAQWQLDVTESKGEMLSKTFLLNDAAQAAIFAAQVDDLVSRQPQSPAAFVVELEQNALSVDVSVRSGTQEQEITEDTVSIASAVDDLGAALQLQGKWG
jgi:hypothetical protein